MFTIGEFRGVQGMHLSLSFQLFSRHAGFGKIWPNKIKFVAPSFTFLTHTRPTRRPLYPPLHYVVLNTPSSINGAGSEPDAGVESLFLKQPRFQYSRKWILSRDSASVLRILSDPCSVYYGGMSTPGILLRSVLK